jgi:hypothetical protein
VHPGKLQILQDKLIVSGFSGIPAVGIIIRFGQCEWSEFAEREQF